MVRQDSPKGHDREAEDKKDESKTLNIRSMSTDEESTSNDRDSPVFGNSSSRPRLRMSRTLNRSMSSKKSAGSPCLFDEEDGGEKAVAEKAFNESFEGLNVKRKKLKKTYSQR